MTDNQFEQMMGMITKSVTSTQKLEREMKETRADIAELKLGQTTLEAGQNRLEEGQNRLEREMRTKWFPVHSRQWRNL